MQITEAGNLTREIGWSVRELARRWDCSERTARAWLEYVPGKRLQPPEELLPWLRAIAAALRDNPVPRDWRQRAICTGEAVDAD